MTAVVLDTNILVAAGFNPSSASAAIVNAVREGALALVWNVPTRRETRAVLEQIPPLEWGAFARLYRDESLYLHEVHPDRFSTIPDPADRKFAALAGPRGAQLVTNDAHQRGVARPLVVD
ncbi:MAG: PIN domain-containing protein, partial [Chloroflexi bacterium]|nr:PIN domain-containing protein [Chloroflexota bacterium]